MVDEAEFCHSCGVELREVGNNSEDSSEDEENDTWEDLSFIDEATMEDIDYPPDANTDGEYYQIMKEVIDENVEKHDLTIDDLGAKQYFTHVVVESILERSHRIKMKEAKKQSKEISMAEEMEARN